MARKNVLIPVKTITDGDMSQATLTSLVTEIQYLDNVGYQLDWTGSPVGTFQIQVSSNYKRYDLTDKVTNAGTWLPLVLTYWDGAAFVTSTTIPTSLGSPIFLDLALLSAPFIRVLYTKGSGTGTLQCMVTGKQTGG